MQIRLTVQNSWFNLFEIACISAASLLLFLWDRAGFWPILVALLPWGLRLLAGYAPIQRTPFDLAIVLFLIFAAIGIWSSYDRPAAWSKFWIVVAAILGYYALSGQPRGNLRILLGLVCAFAALLAVIFLLTQDWRAQPADLRILNRFASLWMAVRPEILGRQLSPNKVGGLLAMLLPLILAKGIIAWQEKENRRQRGILALALISAGVVSFGLLMTSSRGAWFAVGLALGLWCLWYLVERYAHQLNGAARWLLGLTILVVGGGALGLALSNPGRVLNLIAQIPGFPSGYSRFDLIKNTIPLIADFPFTGGGLGAFPGLYSKYMMSIPNFLFGYSHNFYLDVALEQGPFGWIALMVIFMGSGYFLVLSLRQPGSDMEMRILAQAVLVSLAVLAIHGLIDDPLYANRGTPFLLFLPGMAVAVSRAPGKLPGSGSRLGERWTLKKVGKKEWRWIVFGVAVLSIALIMVSFRSLQAAWLANQGAVLMARSQLADFPSERWVADPGDESLAGVERLFSRVLDYDPANRTANHRLGLIAMQHGDFLAAVHYLEAAYQADDDHRGIVKNLAYAYVWSGEYQRALPLLQRIPEAWPELDAYAWWWRTQGRADLALNAGTMMMMLNSGSGSN